MPRSVALLSSGIRASSTKRVSRSQLAMVYAAAFPIESVLSGAWLQSQVFIVERTSALIGATELCSLRQVTLRASVDLVELADPLRRHVRLRVIWRGFLELPEDVGPAT